MESYCAIIEGVIATGALPSQPPPQQQPSRQPPPQSQQ